MTQDTKDLTLAEIVNGTPSAAAVFERHGLDYCCRGDRSLADACAEIRVSPGAVIAEIVREADRAAERGPARDWSRASMTELADHIEQTHHVAARRLLEELAALAPRVAEAHAERHPELAEIRDMMPGFIEEMHDHFVREERVLFPWLRRLDRAESLHKGPPWSVKRPIDCMEHDHDAAGEALARFRELTDGYEVPEGACGSYERLLSVLHELEVDTHMHIHKENNILFPAGIKAEERVRARSCVASPARAFTLIELLVVIAIIALLIGIMLPALGQARHAARSVACLSNTRSIAQAMTVYADDDPDSYFPTARMPGMGPMAAPFESSWISLLAPYLGADPIAEPDADDTLIAEYVRRYETNRCPEDKSQSWDATVMPRLASYGINAYITPNHPPYHGVRPDQLRWPSRTVICAELKEEMGMDHFMPMFWGDPPAVTNPMIQARQWDAAAQLPRVIEHTRHAGERANYVMADGHAAPHAFDDTWRQTTGQPPDRDWYDPKRP